MKKKLLLPVLLLLKLKMKALMPIFVALIGLKALKALILSKLAIAIVIGFVAYQLFSKSGKIDNTGATSAVKFRANVLNLRVWRLLSTSADFCALYLIKRYYESSLIQFQCLNMVKKIIIKLEIQKIQPLDK